nr:anthocyanidin 3-o-glucosyltransferase 5 [Quercus suber]
MLKYVYIASNAWFLAFLYSPNLDKEVEGEYEDQKEPFIIPGCRSLRPHEVFDTMLDRNNQQYHVLIRAGIEIPLSDGILLNIWEDLEPTTLAALRDESLLVQRMNATLLNEEFGVAVRSKVLPTKEVVGREEIETVVRKIMEDNQEGNVIRAIVKQLKCDAEKALSEGGSSNNQLSQVAKHCERHTQRMKVKD